MTPSPWTLTYDANGNLAFFEVTGSSYTYDCENRLIAVANSTMTAVYGYDAFGRRISKTVNNITTCYVYDGANVIAEYDAAGNLERKYVFGRQIDEPVMMVSGSDKYYYHADRLGSITEITDETGAVVEKYKYDAYGNTQVTNANNDVISQSAIGNRFGFTGREIDWETGLYYYRARYYSPRLGSFLQADPIEFYGADQNLYGYVRNNPINYIDPRGKNAILIEVGAVIIIGIAIVDYAQDHWPGMTNSLENAFEAAQRAIEDYITNSKGGNQNHRDSEFEKLSDAEVSARARDGSLSGEERRRYQKEEKARKQRNKQKRCPKGKG